MEEEASDCDRKQRPSIQPATKTSVSHPISHAAGHFGLGKWVDYAVEMNAKWTTFVVIDTGFISSSFLSLVVCWKFSRCHLPSFRLTEPGHHDHWQQQSMSLAGHPP